MVTVSFMPVFRYDGDPADVTLYLEEALHDHLSLYIPEGTYNISRSINLHEHQLIVSSRSRFVTKRNFVFVPARHSKFIMESVEIKAENGDMAFLTLNDYYSANVSRMYSVQRLMRRTPE